MNFDKLDTKYATGDLAKDTQFIRDNLSSEDKAMIEAQLRFIMSVGNDRMMPEGESND